MANPSCLATIRTCREFRLAGPPTGITERTLMLHRLGKREGALAATIATDNRYSPPRSSRERRDSVAVSLQAVIDDRARALVPAQRSRHGRGANDGLILDDFEEFCACYAAVLYEVVFQPVNNLRQRSPESTSSTRRT